MVKRFYEENSVDRGSRVAKQLGSQGSEKMHNLLIIGSGLIGREHIRVASLLGAGRIHGIYDTNQKSMDLAEAELLKYSNEKLVRYPSLHNACTFRFFSYKSNLFSFFSFNTTINKEYLFV